MTPSTPQPQQAPLSQPVGDTGQKILNVPQLSRNDYPNIKYWFRKEWTDTDAKKSGISKAHSTIGTDDEENGENEDEDEEEGRAQRQRNRRHHGGTQCAKGVNVAMRYVEHEDGESVDGVVAASMRKHARSLWMLFAMEGRAPASWGLVDAATRSHYHHDMRTKFPELAFCHDNWKSEQIAIDNYPAWNNGRKVKKIKEEPGVERPDQGRKRVLSSSSTSAPKRSKTSPPSIGSAPPPPLLFSEGEIKLDPLKNSTEASRSPESQVTKEKKEKVKVRC